MRATLYTSFPCFAASKVEGEGATVLGIVSTMEGQTIGSNGTFQGQGQGVN